MFKFFTRMALGERAFTDGLAQEWLQDGNPGQLTYDELVTLEMSQEQKRRRTPFQVERVRPPGPYRYCETDEVWCQDVHP